MFRSVPATSTGRQWQPVGAVPGRRWLSGGVAHGEQDLLVAAPGYRGRFFGAHHSARAMPTFPQLLSKMSLPGRQGQKFSAPDPRESPTAAHSDRAQDR